MALKHLNWIFLFFAFTATSLKSQDITDNLLIHYLLDGNAIDISGNGYDGILNAEAAMDRFGNENGAISFNGVSSFIDLPNLEVLKPPLPISISVWVKFDDLAPQKTTIFTNNFSQNNHSGVWINATTSGNLAAAYGSAYGNSSGGNLRYRRGETFIETDTWYHYVAVLSGPNDIQIYLDCENDGGVYLGSGGPLAYTEDAGSLGRKDVATVPPYYFDGTLDDFMYWDRALTIEEIEALCNNTLSSPQSAAKADFTLYPNPSQEYFSVSGQGLTQLKVYDLSGRLILESAQLERVDVSDFDSGIYLVRVYNNQGYVNAMRLMVE